MNCKFTRFILFTVDLFAVVFVKCVCIWRTSVFFQFYGVLSGVIYNYSPPSFCRTSVSKQVRYRRAVTHPFIRSSTIDL